MSRVITTTLNWRITCINNQVDKNVSLCLWFQSLSQAVKSMFAGSVRRVETASTGRINYNKYSYIPYFAKRKESRRQLWAESSLVSNFGPNSAVQLLKLCEWSNQDNETGLNKSVYDNIYYFLSLKFRQKLDWMSNMI